MKVESRLFTYLVIYFVVVAVIYAVVTDFGEWVGIVGLFLTAAMTGFVAWFFWLSGRNVDPRPEDNLEGEIADQTGDYGHFAPYSWWPLWLGLSTSVLVLGVAVGWWLVVVAFPFVAVAVVGWTFEYFRGARAI
jgi:hypothetical protein